jgi:hypothetical protein
LLGSPPGWLVAGKAEILSPEGLVIGNAGDILSNLGGGDTYICSVGDRTYLPTP